MTTPNPIKAQTDEAMARLTQQINRSAGQHVRAVRRVRAGQPVPSEGTESAQHILCSVRSVGVQHIDLEHLQETRATQQFEEASQAAPCPPGFCGFDPQCSDWACPGHPSHITQWTEGMAAQEAAQEAEEAARSVHMLGWALVALVAVCCFVVVAFFIGLNS